MNSFVSDTSTEEWDGYVQHISNPTQGVDGIFMQVLKSDIQALQEDSNLLYALRKIGAVSPGIEAEAIEFLKEESNMEDDGWEG